MFLLGGLVVVLGGYVSFVARREGASVERALLQGALCAAVLQAIISTSTVWLLGLAWPQMIQPAAIVWALAWVAAVLGALKASPQYELIARW